MMRPEEVLAACKGPPELVDGRVRNGDRVLGTWFPEERRLAWDWSAMGVDPWVIDRGQDEASTFDQWAREHAPRLAHVRPNGQDGIEYGLETWLRHSPSLRAAQAASGIGITLHGKRILDLGGSAQHLVYWLPERPVRVDNVDVSPGTQALGLARLRKAHGDYEAAYGTPVVFHTIPAEHMPFTDGAFDLVFSWSSIHHCARPRVFHEILRVLAPGGTLLVLDRYLSGPLYLAMQARRRALNMDCGTDNPVRRAEWRRLAGMLEDAWWAPFGSGVLLAYLRAKLLRSRRKRPAVSLGSTPARGMPGGAIERWFGRDVVFIGRKPAAS